MKEEQKRIIRIDDPQECRLIERLNRFVVKVEIRGNYHPAHITNTGKLSELLVTGRQAFCFRTQNQGKTDFRLFAIEECGLGALIDTQLQMKAFEPNKGADAELYEALKEVHSSGVELRAIGSYYNPKDAFVYLFEPDLEVRLS